MGLLQSRWLAVALAALAAVAILGSMRERRRESLIPISAFVTKVFKAVDNIGVDVASFTKNLDDLKSALDLDAAVKAGKVDDIKKLSDDINKIDASRVSANDAAIYNKLIDDVQKTLAKAADDAAKNSAASSIARVQAKFATILGKTGNNITKFTSEMKKAFDALSDAEKAIIRKEGFEAQAMHKWESALGKTPTGKRELEKMYTSLGLNKNGMPRQGGVLAWGKRNWAWLSTATAVTIGGMLAAIEIASFVQDEKNRQGGGGGGGGSGGLFGGNSGMSLALFIFVAVGGAVCCCVVSVLAYYMSQKSNE